MTRKKGRKRHIAKGYILMVICGVISIYVFAASYETTFNQDIPVVNAATSFSANPFNRLLNLASKVNQSDSGNYGKPVVLRLPTHNSRIVLAPIVQKGDSLLARANTAHYAILGSPKNGNLGNTFVYFNASWRTDSQPEQLTTKDNIFIDTDRDWRYFYRIDTVREIKQDEEFVMRDGGSASQLTLASYLSNGQIVVIEASLVNVQNVGL